jgi:hypothetical protein
MINLEEYSNIKDRTHCPVIFVEIISYFIKKNQENNNFVLCSIVQH